MTISAKPRILSTFPYLALFIGIFSLSLSAMFVRWANAPGPVTAFYRQLFAVFLLLPVILLRRKHNTAFNLKILIFPILAGVSTAFDLGLWTTALSYTTASNATMIGNTAPIWVALVGLIFFRERLKANFWIGLACTMGGAMLIMGSDFLFHPRLGIGDLMALGTSFFYAGYFLATERGRKYMDPLTYSWVVSVFASLTLFAINLVLNNPLVGYSSQTWMMFFTAAIVSQVIGYTSLSYALGHLPASIVSPTMLGQPVLTTLLAIPLLGEVPGIIQALGGAITLGGIYIVNQAHSQASKDAETEVAGR